MGKGAKNPTKSGQTESSTRCSWSSSDDATLVRVLHQQKDNGNQSGAGWKAQVWQAVADALKAEGASKGPEKTSKKCSDHWANVRPLLKKNFLEVSAICNALGFGWDEGTKICTATDDVWAKYIAAHPNAERWRSAPFPLYDEIHILVNGIVATGEGAFVPGRSLSPTETTASTGSSEAGDSLTTSVTSSSPSILHDTLATDIMGTSRSSESPKPKTPRKRTRAESESRSPEAATSVSHKKKHGKRRKTQADSLLTGMTGAILKLSKSMNSGAGVPTPERRERAVDCLFADKAFSPNAAGDLLELFAEKVAYADTYFVTKDKETRVLFGKKLITRKRA
ncbi:hypothetical protein B0H34DRAFT_755712, partial [Crassisporium funariophilum]